MNKFAIDSMTIRTLTAATVAITAGLIGISASMSGCSDTDGQEKYVAVHIPDADQTVHADGSTWIYPQCSDTNITVSLFDETPAAYLLNASDCVYTAHNHQPYMSLGGIPAAGRPATVVADNGNNSSGSNTDVIAAVPPVIVGRYSVNVYDRNGSGVVASGITLTISSQSGESFVGSAPVTLLDGTSTLSGSISGTCKANGNIRFRITTAQGFGTFSGTVVGNPVQQMSGTAVYLFYSATWKATVLNGASPP